MRLDVYLVAQGHFSTRTKAQYAIEEGLVSVNGKISKSRQLINDCDSVTISDVESYVSLGKFKLKKAINEFSYSVNGKVVADIGASNGGFTQVLLESGSKKVFAIDVGENQLHESLLNDNRVVVMDRQNAKFLTRDMFDCDIDLIVVDVSFISLMQVLPTLKDILKSGGDIILLVKPQFEAGRQHLNKHGIVKDKRIHEQILCRIRDFASVLGLRLQRTTTAPDKGKQKNIEYLCLFKAVNNEDRNIL